MNRKCRFFIPSVLLLLGIIACQGTKIICKNSADLANPADGGMVSMQWDSNTEPKLEGYRVYYGTSPGKYKSCVDVGKATESTPGVVKYTLTGLNKGKRYYIAVIAYDTLHKTSDFSNEVSAEAK
jgi:hypothetical protein